MRFYSGEEVTKRCRFRCKVYKGADAHDAVGMYSEEVVPVRIQIGSFHQMHREVVGHILPDAAATHEVATATASLGRVSVIVCPAHQYERHPEIPKMELQSVIQQH